MLPLLATLAIGGLVLDVWSGAIAGVWVTAAALGAALAGAVGVPAALQVAIFVVLAAALLGLVRPLVVAARHPGPLHPQLLLGKMGSVLDAVDEQLASGRVVIEGVPYVARCLPGCPRLAAGVAVRVQAIELGDIIVAPL